MTEKTHEAVAIVDKSQLPERVHPLVALTMRKPGEVDTETLGKLMDLQERWEANEARKAYTTALVDLKRELPTIIGHDKSVDIRTDKGRVHYTHSSLGAVVAAIIEPLTRYGFSLSWLPWNDKNTVRITCRLTHSGGHFEEATLEAPPDKKGLKSDAQAVESTATQLRRYTACLLLGIATADMDDPKHEKPKDTVDANANLAVAKLITDAGKTKKQAEKIAGKPLQSWTAEDVEKIHAWLEKTAKPSEKLTSALDIIGRAKTSKELEAMTGSLKELQLAPFERWVAVRAFQSRRNEVG